MGNTKATRNADIRSIADAYKIPIKLSDGDIDLCADMAKYDVFMGIFPERHHLFRIENQTFSHGDSWPMPGGDKPIFFGLAGSQYVEGSPRVIIRLARPSELPMVTRNNRLAGTTAQPILYMADRKFYFLPNTVTGATIEYFAYPDPLADPSVDPTATDTMPLDAEPAIARSGFEFMLKIMVERQLALELTKQEIAHTEGVLRNVFEKKYKLLNQEPGEED